MSTDVPDGGMSAGCTTNYDTSRKSGEHLFVF